MRQRRLLLAAGLLAHAAPSALAQDGPDDGPPVETYQIGRSAEGAAISVWRIGAPGRDGLGRTADERPALLIIAGLDGRHDFGTRLALTLADRLLAEHPELLEDRTVYIVPDLNPDNDALFDQPGAPRAEFGRAPRPTDADADGRTSEDPADDLNEDGMITAMRVRDPAPGTGLTPTLVADPDDPRILREPDAAEGELAEYALLVEGLDNDGDGEFNEDGIAGSAGGGVDLDRNFPSLWPEHADGAGVVPLSEPETRSLVEWMLTRDNIVVALAFTPSDNIVNTPAAGKFAGDGREPLGIEEGDKPVYERIKETFQEITSQTGAPTRDWAGSFTHWAYAHFGVYSFATPGWVRPDLIKPREERQEEDRPADDQPARDGAAETDPDAERKSLRERGVPEFLIEFIVATPEERAAIMTEFGNLSEQERADRMAAVAALPEDVQLRVRALISGQPDPAAGGRGRSGRGGREGQAGRERPDRRAEGAAKADIEDWIKYSDEQLDGAGFVPWTEFDHPQLGTVEIGGIVPGIRHEPPESEWARVADEQASFVASVLGMMPTLDVTVAEVGRVAPGLWRVRIRATNGGELPSTSAIGVKARRLAPIVLSPGVEVDAIVSGQAFERVETIPGHGGHADAEWIIRAPDGATVPIEVRSSVFGDRTLNAVLEESD